MNATGILSASLYAKLPNVITVDNDREQRPGGGHEIIFELHHRRRGRAGSTRYATLLVGTTQFTVGTSDASAQSGTVLDTETKRRLRDKNAGTPSTATITVSTFANHNLQVNDHVWLDFSLGSGSVNSTDAEFVVSSIVDEDHFTIVVPNPTNTIRSETVSTSTIYMLCRLR